MKKNPWACSAERPALEGAYPTVLRYSKLDLWGARDLSVFTEYSTVNMRSAGPPPQRGPLRTSYLKWGFAAFFKAASRKARGKRAKFQMP